MFLTAGPDKEPQQKKQRRGKPASSEKSQHQNQGKLLTVALGEGSTGKDRPLEPGKYMDMFCI